MGFEIECPACQARYKVPDTAAGKTARCKKCSGTLRIPVLNEGLELLPEPDPADGYSLLDEALAASATHPLPPPPLPALDSQATAPVGPLSPRPRRKKLTSKGQSGRMFGWGVALTVLGGFMLVIGVREWRLSSLAKSTPQSITLAKLAADGPGDNIYLELTDIELLPGLSVIETERRNLGPERWTYVWIPAAPAGRFGLVNPRDIKVLVGSNRCRDEQTLDEFCRQTTLKGILVNETDGLKAEERRLLNEGLQGVDAASCYLFRAGQGPTSGAIQALILGGGLLVLLIGLGLVGYEVREYFG